MPKSTGWVRAERERDEARAALEAKDLSVALREHAVSMLAATFWACKLKHGEVAKWPPEVRLAFDALPATSKAQLIAAWDKTK